MIAARSIDDTATSSDARVVRDARVLVERDDGVTAGLRVVEDAAPVAGRLIVRHCARAVDLDGGRRAGTAIEDSAAVRARGIADDNRRAIEHERCRSVCAPGIE